MDFALISQAAHFYKALFERIGIKVAASDDPTLMHFHFLGSLLSLDLQNPACFRLSTTYRSAGASITPSPNTFDGVPEAKAFLSIANKINLELGGPVKVVVGTSDVCFESSCFLFGCPFPARLGSFELPILTLQQAEPIARTHLLFVAGVIPMFFQQAHRTYFVSQEPTPAIAPPALQNREDISYFQRAFDEQGVVAKNAGRPQMPEFVFAIEGFHFRMKITAGGWRYLMSIPFVEERRFVPGTTGANIIHGVLTEGFLNHCNRFNAENPGFKCGAFIDPGGVYVIAAGDTPQLPCSHFSHLFPVLWNSLLDRARKLFAGANLPITSFYQQIEKLNIDKNP
jgi:hypothetical protein